MKKAIFEGLVYDMDDRVLPVVFVGSEPTYVIDDYALTAMFRLRMWIARFGDFLSAGIEGKEDMLSEQTAKMLGQEDIFFYCRDPQSADE